MLYYASLSRNWFLSIAPEMFYVHHDLFDWYKKGETFNGITFVSYEYNRPFTINDITTIDSLHIQDFWNYIKYKDKY